jgi:hypothetical protein
MALKQVGRKVEVLEIDGTKFHALRPNKATWDEYGDALFERDSETGELKIKSGRGLKALYVNCIKKVENVDIEGEDGVMKHVDAITDPEEIVSFIQGLTDIEAGRKLDSWLLSLGDLTKGEQKNSRGEPKLVS